MDTNVFVFVEHPDCDRERRMDRAVDGCVIVEGFWWSYLLMTSKTQGVRMDDAMLHDAQRGRPRLHLLLAGVSACVVAGGLAFAPEGARPALGLGLLASGVWCAWSMQSLALDDAAKRRAALRAAWPWMKRPKQASVLMHTSLTRWRKDITKVGPSYAGRHGRVIWEWAQAECRPVSYTPNKDAEDARAAVPVWVLSILLEEGMDLHWGDLIPAGAERHGKMPPRVVPSAGFPSRWHLYADDATAVLRAWDPVACEALQGVAPEPVASIHALGPCGCVVVPAVWLEGPDRQQRCAALIAALRAATGRDRWDKATGGHWVPKSA